MKVFKNKVNKKIFVILIVGLLVTISCVFANYVSATDAPYLELSHIANCNEGATVSFNVYIKGNNIKRINLTRDSVQLIGFNANVSVRSTGSRSYNVILDNVKGGLNGNRVVISGNVAMSNDNRTGAAYSSAVTSNNFSIIGTDNIAPTLSIIGPSVNTVKNGDSLTFIARYTDNVKIKDVILYKNSIKLNGFTANISISGSGANSKVVERTITLSNIQGSNGNKSITICDATASDTSSNRANGATSKVFKINNNVSSSEITQNNQNNNTNENDNTNDNNDNDNDNQNNNQQDSTKPSDWIPNPKTGIY